MNKKILISLSVIGAVAAIAIGGTIAYFSDTETSTGNTFTAGSIDLKIDLQTDEMNNVESFELVDLNGRKLFEYQDVKPGDSGEMTVSGHVYNNDACGRYRIDGIVNDDNGITEPEDEVDGIINGSDGTTDGDLDDYLMFRIWVDWGQTPGWQNATSTVDPYEGDNEYQVDYEPPVTSCGGDEWCLLSDIDPNGETWDLYEMTQTYLKGSTTYYTGVEWQLPWQTGNIVQSDKWGADMSFDVIQYRNNEECVWPN